MSVLILPSVADLRDRFLAKGRGVRFAVLALSGAVAGLGHAPFDLWYLTVAALAVLFSLCAATTVPRQVMFHVWAFGFGYFVVSLRWIVEPFLVDIARHGWMAPFALFLMGAGAALFWAVAAYIGSRISPRSAIMLALMLVVAELARSVILTGFPWALIGHIWVPTGLAQLAALGGPHLLSLVTVVAALSVMGLLGQARLWGIGGIALLVVAGLTLRAGPAPEGAADGPVVRLVQPNAPQDQKWDPRFRDTFVNRLITLTGQGEVPDLVVWPETSLPYLLNQIEDEIALLSDAARGAPLVFGILRRDADWRVYNSLVVLGAGGAVQSLYDKQHLVPFGEYVPFGDVLGRWAPRALAQTLPAGFTAGQVGGPIDLPGIGLAVPLICYEGIFAEEIAGIAPRPRLLLLITNDAWFGQAAGPRQHLAQARLRAIEHGLPMVRVANTGISAMIDGKGRILAAMPLGVDGVLDTVLPPALPPTYYSRFGGWPVFFLLFFLILAQSLRAWRDSD